MRIFLIISISILCLAGGCAQKLITRHDLITQEVKQYQKAEFDIEVSSTFKNPYDEREVALDMLLTSPSGKSLMLPCYYVSDNDGHSFWKARFTPQESGSYTYHFRLKENGTLSGESPKKSFDALTGRGD